jgi:Ca2+/Na+ antiporter
MKDLVEYLQGPYVVNIFLVMLFIFYMFFVEKNIVRNFFIAIILIVVVIILYTKKQKQEAKDSNEDKYIEEIEARCKRFILLYDNIYQVHKAPRSLKFIKRSRDLKRLIYDMRHYLLYDEESFIKFVCLLEYFLKYHFLIISERYEYGLYYPVMRDIRRNMINHLYSMYYNFPKYSTVRGVDDMDEYLYKKIAYVQSYTLRYMKILNNKYATSPLHIPPFANDDNYDPAYSMI